MNYANAERNTATYDEEMENQRPPEPDVPKKARRRIYPPSYKVRILKEYESLPPRERAALLRREGLYSSHITSWRRTFAKGGKASRGASATIRRLKYMPRFLTKGPT